MDIEILCGMYAKSVPKILCKIYAELKISKNFYFVWLEFVFHD